MKYEQFFEIYTTIEKRAAKIAEKAVLEEHGNDVNGSNFKVEIDWDGIMVTFLNKYGVEGPQYMVGCEELDADEVQED